MKDNTTSIRRGVVAPTKRAQRAQRILAQGNVLGRQRPAFVFRHDLKTPTAFHPNARGWSERPTLGMHETNQPTLKGLHQNTQTVSNPFRVGLFFYLFPG